ncbi:MAG: O-antigen ligase family protein [Solirubrobacterales bacterium]|nr:O-antigen ligase family protein [Solirubrobacterales bacterium]
MSIASPEPPSASKAATDDPPPDPVGTGPAASFGTALLAVVFSWWAWKEGAYFPAILLPGLFVLCAGIAVMAIAVPRLRARRLAWPTVLATICLLSLALWSALSALWSPAPNLALGDAQRIGAYALALGLGGWIAVSAGSRRELALFPLMLAGLFAGAIATVALLGGDNPGRYLNDDGTLQAPIGYRNATSAFFAIAFLASIGLASARRVDWRVRGLASGTATLCAGLAVVCQSRASAPAFAVALLALVLISPLKLRTLCWLALGFLPALLVLPSVIELFQVTDDTRLGVVGPEMKAVGFAVGITSAVSVAVGLLVAYMGSRLPGFGSSTRRSNRAVLVGVAVSLVAAAGAFLVAVGDPVSFAEKRLEELRSLETPGFESSSTRFGVSAGTGRLDFWELAVSEIGDNPVDGAGGGAFGYEYTRERTVERDVQDAHSVELEVGSELGLVGLGLLVVAIAGAALGAWRSRPEGERAASVSAFALAIGVYWLAHASVDWFWSVPAVTAPVLAVLGAAAGARAVPVDRRRRVPGVARRGGLVVLVALLAATTVPPFLSDRYLTEAGELRVADPEGAYRAIERAEKLNPLDDVPYLVEGEIARLAGDRERARLAYEKAIEVRPAEWAGHYYLAILAARPNPQAGRQELAAARELNPLERCIEDLEQALACAPGSG